MSTGLSGRDPAERELQTGAFLPSFSGLVSHETWGYRPLSLTLSGRCLCVPSALQDGQSLTVFWSTVFC